MKHNTKKTTIADLNDELDQILRHVFKQSIGLHEYGLEVCEETLIHLQCICNLASAMRKMQKDSDQMVKARKDLRAYLESTHDDDPEVFGSLWVRNIVTLGDVEDACICTISRLQEKMAIHEKFLSCIHHRIEMCVEETRRLPFIN